MIKLTREAREYIVSKNIKEIYIDLRYTKGPCNDNLCKMIPHLEVTLVKPRNSTTIIFEEPELKIFASIPIANSILKHRDNITVSKSKLGRSFRITGITYSY
ncbi:MAG: hypothetical protein M1526_01735 [Candidatus Thermoplasmatota archaeon]|jgi:hypothetical protein|nr:hypothetical protein [Candidatus Thermoplasmatota archaeon]